MVAAIGSGTAFARGRDFAAWLGLVPKQMSTGAYLRRLPGLARYGDAHDQLAVGTNHRRRHGLGVRGGIGCVEVDDVADHL